MATYNKLVRDKIPEIIEASGKIPIYYELEYEDYKKALRDKLLEEVNEFLAAKTKDEMIEELADIEDILFLIRSEEDIDFNYFMYIKNKKRNEKGHFYKRYFLESVED